MKLLCKLVTNPLKPMACAHPINLCNSLGSGLSDLHHCIGCRRGPWLESVTNFPFLPVALSWRPSLFLLRDSDIGHNIKKSECQRIDAFELWCWRRFLRVPWITRRFKKSILKDVSPDYKLEGLMLKLKLQYLATWCKELTHLKRPWCCERLKAGEGDDRG